MRSRELRKPQHCTAKKEIKADQEPGCPVLSAFCQKSKRNRHSENPLPPLPPGTHVPNPPTQSPPPPPPPLCDIPSGCCSFTGPWTVTRSSLRTLRRVAAFCRPLRPVLLPVSFLHSESPVVGVLGLCWMWRDVPFERQRRPIVGVLGVVLVVAGVV